MKLILTMEKHEMGLIQDLEAQSKRRAATRRAARKAASQGVNTATPEGAQWLRRAIRRYLGEGQ